MRKHTMHCLFGFAVVVVFGCCCCLPAVATAAAPLAYRHTVSTETVSSRDPASWPKQITVCCIRRASSVVDRLASSADDISRLHIVRRLHCRVLCVWIYDFVHCYMLQRTHIIRRKIFWIHFITVLWERARAYFPLQTGQYQNGFLQQSN